jgi:hypothetical protein
MGASTYNLQEQVGSSGWTPTVQSGTAATWSASGKVDGSYSYQVQACDTAGCGPWSAVETVVVTLPITTAPTLSAPFSSTSSYTVSWSTVPSATSYNLQEQVSDLVQADGTRLIVNSAWNTVQGTNATSWGVSGKALGSYLYEVQACNAAGCGPWSIENEVTVGAPASPTNLSITNPTKNTFTVSWDAMTGATNYEVTIPRTLPALYAGTATSYSGSGSGPPPTIWVVACNNVGCSQPATLQKQVSP